MKNTAALALVLLAACGPPIPSAEGEKVREVRCEGTAHGLAVRYGLSVYSIETWNWATIRDADGRIVVDYVTPWSELEPGRPDRWTRAGYTIYLHETPLRISVDAPSRPRVFVKECREE